MLPLVRVPGIKNQTTKPSREVANATEACKLSSSHEMSMANEAGQTTRMAATRNLAPGMRHAVAHNHNSNALPRVLVVRIGRSALTIHEEENATEVERELAAEYLCRHLSSLLATREAFATTLTCMRPPPRIRFHAHVFHVTLPLSVFTAAPLHTTRTGAHQHKAESAPDAHRGPAAPGHMDVAEKPHVHKKTARRPSPTASLEMSGAGA